MTHQEILRTILAQYAVAVPDDTCDGFKSGNPNDECRGIVTTCALTIDVIRETIRCGCNLVITHEPSFYSHDDSTEWLDGNQVYCAKQKLLYENGITVWRNHDHMHFQKPDEIMQGVLQELDWLKYRQGDLHDFHAKVRLPETTVEELVTYLCTKMNLKTGRVVGNPHAKVSNIVFCGHVFPSWSPEEQRPTYLLASDDVDVLIPGELIDWTVVEYARDAAQLGLHKAIIQVGHFNMEELGMEYLKERIQTLLQKSLPVFFVPSGDPYWFV